MQFWNLLKGLLGVKESVAQTGFTEDGIYEVKGYGKLIARPLTDSVGWRLNTLKVQADESEKTVLVVMRFGHRIMQVDARGWPVIPTTLTLHNIKQVTTPHHKE